jgi:YidC/Oxa1 family membrane protein insertase
MNIFSVLLTQILYRPIFNVLIVFLSLFGGNLGIAIILLTLLIRGIMFKSTAAGANMQQGMSSLQPKIEELQKKYADNPQKLSEETMKLFKSEGKAPLK